MKVKIPIFLLAIGLVSYAIWQQPNQKQDLPKPTDTILHEGEDGENQLKREAWFELMHQAEEGINWRQIEYQNAMNRHRLRTTSVQSRTGCEEEELANGNVLGSWSERGSIDQAGSVFDIEYDAQADVIWTISAGGSLFKSDRFGNSWEVINQDLRFSHGILKFIPTDNGRRMIAFIDRIPHYSDDDGYTWTMANGINPTDNWGTFRHPVVVEDGNGGMDIYVMAKPNYWADFSLYRSIDNGETYQNIETLSSYDQNLFALCKPHHTNDVLLVEKASDDKGRIYLVNQSTGDLEWINEGSNLNFGGGRANLTAWDNGTESHYYVVREHTTGIAQVLESTDGGQAWAYKGNLPTSPWDVGMYVLPSNPDVLLMGEVECHVSTNAGTNWETVNAWWEYYDAVETKIHADIMDFNEFETADGEHFLLVSNHGGIQMSTDYMENQQNIGMSGLNVSQYYSVRTDPLNSNYVYAGSQDQGFQRSTTFEDDDYGVEGFEQVISGDYGHIVFTGDGEFMWTVYPGGSVSLYGQPQTGGITGSYNLESDNESVWIPPLMASTNPSENAIYMAGGNINGGAGSHLVKLTRNFSVITPTQSTLDFLAEAGGEVSAIGSTPLNPDRLYVATTNGRFFYSTDLGQTWDQTAIFLPSGHYLYGQSILGSKIEANTVYLGGSGYSNPAVYKSTDGGETFVDMSQGLPSTLVFGLAANEDESLLFAATEAGPYVYVAEDGLWYDMAGFCAPAQTYWSVEYVEDIQTVRFGTYGRGIWDFAFSEPVNTDPIPESAATTITVFPNPGEGLFSFQLDNTVADELEVMIYDMGGKLLKQYTYDVSTGSDFRGEADLTNYPLGQYILVARNGAQTFTEKLLIQR